MMSVEQGASALMALPVLVNERSRDYLVRGSVAKWPSSVATKKVLFGQ